MNPIFPIDRTGMKRARVLALGGGGFIGAHLTDRLLREGHEVVSVDVHSDKLGQALQHPRLTFIEKSIRDDTLDLGELARDSDLVIDLIAYANPGLYVKMPLEVFRELVYPINPTRSN